MNKFVEQFPMGKGEFLEISKVTHGTIKRVCSLIKNQQKLKELLVSGRTIKLRKVVGAIMILEYNYDTKEWERIAIITNLVFGIPQKEINTLAELVKAIDSTLWPLLDTIDDIML